MENKIKNIVKELKHIYGCNDPFIISRYIGIWVYIFPIGKLDSLFMYSHGKDVLFINENLDYHKQKFICAHMLGHFLLHNDKKIKEKKVIHGNKYSLEAPYEREADIFAKELLNII